MPLFGMDMATPPKIPVLENPPAARALSPLIWVGIIAIAGVTAAVLLPPLLPPAPPSEVTTAEPALTPADAGAVCLLLSENPKEYLAAEEMQRRTERRRAACN